MIGGNEPGSWGGRGDVVGVGASSQTAKTRRPELPTYNMPPPLLSAPLTAALMPLESTMREPTKSSITFILHDGDDGEFQAEDTKIIKEEATEDGDERVVGRAARPVPRVIAPAAARARAPVKMARKAGVSGTSEKRKARCCTVDGCENYTINRGLCFRHGGGKRCSMEDCTASAKHAGLCWKHGIGTAWLCMLLEEGRCNDAGSPANSMDSATSKCSLEFILGDDSDDEHKERGTMDEHSLTQDAMDEQSRMQDRHVRSSPSSENDGSTHQPPRVRRRTLANSASKRKARNCSVDGCENYTINRGLCFRHGGGKRCVMDGCTASAKHAGLCWKHGMSADMSSEQLFPEDTTVDLSSASSMDVSAEASLAGTVGPTAGERNAKLKGVILWRSRMVVAGLMVEENVVLMRAVRRQHTSEHTITVSNTTKCFATENTRSSCRWEKKSESAV
ncbi:TPA: hypothetical protein N0F65_011513, partial [Lagenidium giganteum]